MANYPGSLPSIATAGANLSTNPHSTLHNGLRDELLAVATELGTAPRGSFTDVKARLTSMVKSPSGALTTWTPAITQGVAVSSTVAYARYQRVGRLIIGWCYLAVTSSGTSGNTIVVTLPVTSVSADLVIGSYTIAQISGASDNQHVGSILTVFTTSMGFVGQGAAGTPGGTTPLAGAAGSGFNYPLLATDLIRCSFAYEAAAD